MFKFKKPTLCTVASSIVGLGAAIILGGIARSVGAHPIVYGGIGAVFFVLYAKLAVSAFKDATKISDLFNIRR